MQVLTLWTVENRSLGLDCDMVPGVTQALTRPLLVPLALVCNRRCPVEVRRLWILPFPIAAATVAD